MQVSTFKFCEIFWNPKHGSGDINFVHMIAFDFKLMLKKFFDLNNFEMVHS